MPEKRGNGIFVEAETNLAKSLKILSRLEALHSLLDRIAVHVPKEQKDSLKRDTQGFLDDFATFTFQHPHDMLAMLNGLTIALAVTAEKLEKTFGAPSDPAQN